MSPEQAIDLGQEALLTALLIGAPVLLMGVIVGLVIGLLQALTQIQDQTIAFVPKIIAMVLTLMLTLPWLVERMVDYSETLISNIPRVMQGQQD